MAYSTNELQRFRQLRDRAARKKALEVRRAELLPQHEALAAQAEAKKQARIEAEREVANLESTGALGLLYTVAGGKAQRLERAREILRDAKAQDQEAAWDLAQVQGELAQTERELDDLADLDDAMSAARTVQRARVQAAGLPQSRQLLLLEGGLAHETTLVQDITDLLAQCRAALEAAQMTAKLAFRVEQWRDFTTTQLLQHKADQSVQLQEEIEQKLAALLTQVEAERLRLEDAQDDLLAQDTIFRADED